jgi:hypothetical protein
VTLPGKARRRARRTSVPPRVGLFGLLGQGNLGNDGSMEAVLAYLRAEHPDVILDALCPEPDLVTVPIWHPGTPCVGISQIGRGNPGQWRPPGGASG